MVSPVEQVDELAYVEQELEDLQDLIKQHFTAIKELDDVKSKVGAVTQFESAIETVNRKAESTFERFEKGQLILKDRTDVLEARIKKLSSECNQLKQTMDQTMSRCAEEWAKQQNSMQMYMDEFEARIQNDVKHAVNRLGEAGAASSVQRERVEKLDVRVRGLSNSVKRMGNTLKAWNGVAIAISVIGLIAISVVAVYAL